MNAKSLQPIRSLILTGAVLALLLLTGQPASAGTRVESPTGNCTFIGPSGAPWSNPANWNCGYVPGAGDTATVNGIVTVDTTVTVGNLNLTPGEVWLSNPLTVSGTFNFTGGRIAGGTFNLPSGSVANISAAATKAIESATVNNSGTVNWSATGDLGLNSSTFNNQAGGIFDAQSDARIGFGVCAFNNAGTFRKSAGAGTTVIAAPFNNTGTLRAQSGTIALWSAGANSASFIADSGAAIAFSTSGPGSYNLNSGATLTGAGFYKVTTGILTLNTPVSIPKLQLESPGTITGNGLSVTDTFLWTGGTLQDGSATLDNGATATLSGSNQKILDNYTLTNNGTFTWTGTGDISAGHSAVFHNQAGAVFDAQNDQSFTYYYSPMGTINNAGTFKKSAGTGTTTINVTFNNTGNTLQALTGTIALWGGGTETGIFNFASGTTLDFHSGTYSLTDGTQLTGSGTFLIDGSAIVNLSGTVTVANLTLSGGTLNLGSANLALAGDFTRSGGGGTLNAGTSTLAFNGGVVQNLSLNVATTLYNLTIGSGTTLIETAATDYVTVGGTLTNNGVIRKTQAIAATGAKTFGLTGASTNVTTLGTLSNLQVDRRDTNHSNASGKTATGRYWTFTPTGSGYALNLTLPHNVADHSIAEACRYTGSVWDCARTSSTSTTVTRNGVTQLSDWAVGYPVFLYLPLVLR